MKLTKKRLHALIRECLLEHRGVAMKDRGIKGQQIAREREEENIENTKEEKAFKDRLYPGARELMSLSRGVIAENEMEDIDGEFINKLPTHLQMPEKESLEIRNEKDQTYNIPNNRK